MALSITEIEVTNFRSIRHMRLSSTQLTVFVGKNDSGKSNILRALNLFFNEETDPHRHLVFEDDHNTFNKPNRRAKEIVIALTIALPKTYTKTNGDFIVWKKSWRKNGLHKSHYFGKRISIGRNGTIKSTQVPIPDNSNVHALLRNITFMYVPAIKDRNYIAHLRASIFGAISEAARTFRKSSQEFESSIATHLSDLTDEITETMGFTSRLALPRDLSHVFESLDFLTDEQDISLDARGDGIKARHIPIILKFIADKKRGLQHHGAPPHSFIWGYEEPENNLEFSGCVELADQFCDFLDHGICQIFLTTHSPVFYNLHRGEKQKHEEVANHHVFKDKEEEGSQCKSASDDLDDRMGTTALVAPLVHQLELRIRRLEESRANARMLVHEGRHVLFVEGPSDKMIVERTLEMFCPDESDNIIVETKSSGGGYRYVIDMLSSWCYEAKHGTELPRCAGLVDADKDAVKHQKEFNAEPNRIKYAKCFRLPETRNVRKARAAGFKIETDLELMYDRKVWEWARKNDKLEERELGNVIRADLAQKILLGDTELREHLSEDWSVFVLNRFTQPAKAQIARHICQWEPEKFRRRMTNFQPLMEEIVEYLSRDN